MRLLLSLIVLWLGATSAIALADDRASSAPDAALMPWVPPYPGPVPVSWPSMVDYERYAELRALQLDARQQGLAVAGRPERYQLKRTTLLSSLAVGSVITMVAAIMLVSYPSERALSAGEQRVVGSMLLTGGSLVIAGGAGVLVLKRRNANRDEIRQLRLEQGYWVREAKRVKRELAEGGFELSLHGLGLRATF